MRIYVKIKEYLILKSYEKLKLTQKIIYLLEISHSLFLFSIVLTSPKVYDFSVLVISFFVLDLSRLLTDL